MVITNDYPLDGNTSINNDYPPVSPVHLSMVMSFYREPRVKSREFFHLWHLSGALGFFRGNLLLGVSQMLGARKNHCCMVSKPQIDRKVIYH